MKMSGPPTPVLDCPLVYLEIRDGTSARAYNSQSHGTFTLTVEGQRRVDAETGALIILIRKETQQVVSLRLAGTGEDSGPPGDMVSINKQANRLCICVPGRPQAILVQFLKTRDFSVTACLLQKAGFHVSDALPTTLLTNLPTYGTTSNYGPLLSSITPPSLLPLNASGGPETQNDLSFAAMLTAPFQPFQPSTTPNPWVSHTQRYVSVPVQPYPFTNQVVNAPPLAAQLNPYNMFLGGGNAYSYVARTSSPIGHPFAPNPPSTHWHDNNIGTISNFNAPAPGLDLYEPVVHANLGPNNLGNSKNNDVGSHTANGLMRNETTDEPGHCLSPQNKPQEYRDLMPQPRTLPFESSKKGYKAGGRSKPQETKQLEAVKARKPRKTGTATQSIATTAESPKKVQATKTARKRANVKQRQPNEGDATPGKSIVQLVSNHKQAYNTSTSTSELTIPSKKSKQDTYEDAQCQTDMQPEPNGAVGSLETADFVEQSPTPDSSPLVVVTDPDTLKDLHEATATLFEEYEKGVEHCGDEVRHAELYLHKIWEKRRDFWLRRLRDNTDVQWYSQADESIASLDSAA